MIRFVLGILMVSAATLAASEKRPQVITDLFQFERINDPQISPDGKRIVYQVTKIDLNENRSNTHLYLWATDGKSEPKALTTSPKSDRHPRWSPDGKTILFESTRSGTSQLWVVPVEGGEPKQLTTISSGASNGIWSPDGKSIAFVSAVYPEFSEQPFREADELNQKKSEEASKNPVKAKVFTKLFYRHWDEYVEDKRQHLFVINADGTSPMDVTPGDRDAYPTSSTFSQGDDFTFSPDSSALLFTAVPEANPAWNTNHDICWVRIHNRKPEWLALTGKNPGADAGPLFSPNGKLCAYRSQKTPGYEADKWDLMIVECQANGKWNSVPKNMTASLDRSVDSYVWSADNESIFFLVEENAASRLYQLSVSTGKITPQFTAGQMGSLGMSKLGDRLVFTESRLNYPPQVRVLSTDAITDKALVKNEEADFHNGKLLKELERPRPESVLIPVEGDVKMQMWILKPPGFDAKKKWPVAFLVHGGPQGAWEDGWSFRWNAQAWAAQGYVVVLPNPRGSTGFGQKYVNEISGDWGGKCYRDLLAALTYVDKLPYVDPKRIATAGASFGGYMMNWFAVNPERKFKCIIGHCGVWNFESMWGTTDELWFDEYEHGGLPWDKPEAYAEFSPHKKAAQLGKSKTPMLVIQNDLDFRCPIGQGHELFSALQRQGVPSRFINFPDEGHWVLKPKNSFFWHQEVFAWLKKYNPPGGK